MALIPEWRRAWRMASMQAMTLATAIQGAWLYVPEDLKSTLPPNVVHWASIVLLAAGIVGRLVDQPKVRDPQPQA
jgi:hypothetical protein